MIVTEDINKCPVCDGQGTYPVIGSIVPCYLCSPTETQKKAFKKFIAEPAIPIVPKKYPTS